MYNSPSGTIYIPVNRSANGNRSNKLSLRSSVFFEQNVFMHRRALTGTGVTERFRAQKVKLYLDKLKFTCFILSSDGFSFRKRGFATQLALRIKESRA